MTTTHTFHGLNTESRSSSRVLNPPGGLSNNIFGSDNQVKHSCVGSNTEVSREKSDNVGPGAAVKKAGPQQKPWAPPRSAFNPITGELYDQPKPKSEPQLNVTPSPEICNNSPVEVVKLPAVTAVAPVVENIQPAEIVQPVPVEVVQPVPEEIAPPVAADEPGAQEKPQASQSGRMFGESAEGAKPHSSTRVSQPPGGHSSKLW